jgi:hypothetical protein
VGDAAGLLFKPTRYVSAILIDIYRRREYFVGAPAD